MPEYALTEVRSDALDHVKALLAASGLPFEDLVEAGRRFYRLEQAGRLLGVAGLEIVGTDALLRSVVVLQGERGAGAGATLVSRVEAAARQAGVERLWLLTTTAAPFFARLGYRAVPRDTAPETIAATREFRDICPASATCMTRDLADRG